MKSRAVMKYVAVILLAIIATGAQAQGVNVNYNEGSTALKGYLVKPKAFKVKSPGVVILHQWMGLTDHEKKSAGKLANLGYVAFAADIYGQSVKVTNTDEAGKLSGSFKADRSLYRARIKAAIDQVIKAGADPNNIAVIGYCFGGTGALEAAWANMPVKGVVSFHGGLDKGSDPISTIKPKVLVLHGADDPFVPKPQVDAFQSEMKEARADWQLIYYADAVHAFTQPEAGTDNSKGAAYNEAADRRSWQHMKLFLQEIFGR